MFCIKKAIIGCCVGLLLGLWMGVNIGKHQPLWANPFAERSLSAEAKAKAKEVIKDTKKALRDKLKD